ncbi:Asp-tRNA(Asn)/Glu-tRNA(Gln) amidotransferase subunit GatB [Candidatus Saccharibacteria bacterium]|nr:Asp-tRNA(Asn)/Glu-tRNA(Gln) amidotransferase subunit GatB [Candidatus Saccharibacteria bacterium]
MRVSEYTPTIGIETHVQLKTKTKLFAAVDNDARQAPPNTLISHICVGMPGALPVLNEAAIELCARAAVALGTEPQKFSYFERKHYFYPDLPKGYQITQYETPIIAGGHLHIEVNGTKKCVRIERANLEEDAGKNTHPAGADYSLVDFNRAGTPLLEIVSMPDIHSAAEAKAYARELWLAMKYAGVTDGDLYHGHVRFDVNVSVSENPDRLGIRSEIKNLNSFRSVEAAVDYEIKRQTELQKKGQPVVQETRGWDEAKQKSLAQRSKEEAQDYRYMPEPDIPPIELDDDYIKKTKTKMPSLPNDLRMKFEKLDLPQGLIESLLDNPQVSSFMSRIMANKYISIKDARRIANWLAIDVQSLVNLGKISWDTAKLSEKALTMVSHMLDDNKINSTTAKNIVFEIVVVGGDPNEIARIRDWLQVSDEAEIEKIVAEVIAENPKPAQDVKNGELKAIGFLVGQVMAKSKGQANPEIAKKLIKKQLGL